MRRFAACVLPLQLGLVAALMPPPRTARAGVVVSAAAGRLEGAVSLQPGALRVGATTVPWTDVLLAINGRCAEPPGSAEVLHLTNGETWAGTIKLAAGRMSLDSALLGHREIDVKSVQAIDFIPGLPAAGRDQGKMLYRYRAHDLPCSLVWIRNEQVAINTVVGAVALDKKGLERYVFVPPLEPAAGVEDELALRDGSVLHGRIEPTKDGLLMTQALLGHQLIRPEDWSSIRRRGNAANRVELAELKPVSIETFPLIRARANPPRTERAAVGERAGFVRRLRMWPTSTVVYRVPGPASEKFLFTAGLGLSDGSHGAARVRMRSGDRVVFDRVLVPRTGDPATVSFEVEGGSDLKLEVDFDRIVRFPCEIVLDDALLIRR